jgi:hypothetical protein
VRASKDNADKYVVVGSTNTCLSSIVDSKVGNIADQSGTEVLCKVHQEMRKHHSTILWKIMILSHKRSPMALWIPQMAYQTKLYPDSSGKCVFFMDNIYSYQRAQRHY